MWQKCKIYRFLVFFGCQMMPINLSEFQQLSCVMKWVSALLVFCVFSRILIYISAKMQDSVIFTVTCVLVPFFSAWPTVNPEKPVYLIGLWIGYFKTLTLAKAGIVCVFPLFHNIQYCRIWEKRRKFRRQHSILFHDSRYHMRLVSYSPTCVTCQSAVIVTSLNCYVAI